MDKHTRATLDGWVAQASRQLGMARDSLSSGCYPEAIQAAQQCIEFSLKAMFAFLGIEYPRQHGLSRQEIARVAREIRDKKVLERLVEQGCPLGRLPRLMCLGNFWAEMYLSAKYGIQDGYLATAADLLERGEASLAVDHAWECWLAANEFRSLSDERLTVLVSPSWAAAPSRAPPPKSDSQEQEHGPR
jgi:hypothetical protein